MKKLSLLLFCLLTGLGIVLAQSTTIRGNIVDELGDPVIGASIKEKGTANGTVTDIEGNFQLTVSASSKQLTISYVGYRTVDVSIQPVVNVQLAPEAQELTEVVVTGYQKIDRKMFTGAASIVKAEDAMTDGVADVSRMLQGKAAGVQVTNVSGTFGSAPKLRVRGSSSIYGNSNPLWVVDGVVLDDLVNISADELSSGNASTLISSAVAGLSSDDIETFQILKDASATALYGARAMNGVIVITTKRGREGSSSISYTGEFTTRLKPNYNQYDIMNSQDQMSVYMEMRDKGLLNPSTMFVAKNGGVFSQMYNLMDQTNADGTYKLANTPGAQQAFLRDAELRNTDWFDKLFRNTVQQSHAVSISTGTKKSSTYASLSYMHDPGWTYADKVSRFTLNINSTYKFTEKLSFTINGNASSRTQKAPGSLKRSVDVVGGGVSRDFDINPFSYALNTSRTMDADTDYKRNYADFNIFSEMDNNYIEIGVLDTKFQGELNYKPIQGLDLSALFAARYAKTTQEHMITEDSNMANAYRAMQSSTVIDNNNFLWTDPDNAIATPISVLPTGGFYNTTDNAIMSYYARFSANYNRVFTDHALNFLLGGELRSLDRTNRYAYGYGYVFASAVSSTDYRILRKMLDADSPYFGMDKEYERSLGLFATGTYSYQGTYTLNATVRTEGSNQLGRGANAKWLPTWNVSGSWNILNESFMESLRDNNLISLLTLRGTYGMTASMPPASYVRQLAMLVGSMTYRPFADDRELGYEMYQLENDKLTWEKMYETNIGFDFGLLRNRFTIGFDAYWRNSFDLIGRINTSSLGGTSTRWGNFADMKGHGFEFLLSTQNINKSKFKWGNTLTFSYNKTKITDLKSQPRVIDLAGVNLLPKEGYDVRSVFSVPFAGLDENGFPTFFNENGDVVSYVNFQSRSTDFLVYEGSADPRVTGGFENSLTYGPFKFDLYFTYQFGSVIRLYPTYSATYSDDSSMPKDMRNRWTKPGDEEITNIPVIPSSLQMKQNSELNKAYNTYNYSTERVAKGDFIRLKDITLTYTFPKDMISNIGFNSLQLRCVASNMWLIYSDKKLQGQDPEFIRSGGVAMPTAKQFTISIRAGF